MDITIFIILIAAGAVLGAFSFFIQNTGAMIITGLFFLLVGLFVIVQGIDITAGVSVDTIEHTINNTTTSILTNQIITKSTISTPMTYALGIFILAIGIIFAAVFSSASRGDPI